MRWLRAVAQSSTVLGIAMIGLVWASIAFHLASERQSAEQAAVENAGNLGRAFEAHLSQSLNDIDRTLDMLRAYYLRDPAKFDFRAGTNNTRMFDKDVVQLVLIGPDGIMVASSISSETGVDLRDREHFKVHVDSHEDRLFISKPVVGRVSGRTTIQLSRRIERSDGSFGGVILASLDPSYFARLYDSIEVGAEGYIRVIGTDGIIRAAGGSMREEPGRDISGSRLFKELATRRSGWFFTASNLTDRVPRLLVYRTAKDYPLVITLGRASKEIFAAVSAKRKSYNFIAGLLTILILAAIAHSVQGRLQLDRASERLRRQNARFHAALNNMPHGVSMYDRHGRFVVSNARYLEMYGLTPEDVTLGTMLHQILACRMKLHGTPGDPQALARSLLARIALGKPVPAFATTKDGRVISITNQPMADGGFVATHEDITERQRAQRELKSTKIFLDTVIENIPLPLVVKDARTQKFVFVNHAYEEFIGRTRDQVIGLTVHDLYPLDHAQSVVERDIEALHTGNGLVRAEFVLATPRGPRIVNTVRLVVGGDDGAPGHLIVLLDDVTDRRKSEERIVHMAMHDALTDLPNRTQFQARLREALARVERGERLAVLCLDLDNFKTVNDTLGHDVGDALLKIIASRLRASVRGDDFVARIGGDEFCVLLQDIADPREAAAVAQKLLHELGKSYRIGEHQVSSGASIGIACVPQDGDDVATLLRLADLAMYRAKELGRNGYQFFSVMLNEDAAAAAALVEELRQGMTRGELFLVYQPRIDIATRQVVGAEALLRWRLPGHGDISPSHFIPLAEETSLILDIGEWVLNRVCSDYREWQKVVPHPGRIAINLSLRQLKQSSFISRCRSVFRKHGVSPTCFELEVTETTLMTDPKRTIGLLNELYAMGLSLAIDDFGTGYSSLSALQQFPIGTLKIDQSFVRDVAVDTNDAAIVRTIIDMGRSLDLEVIAEGVEEAQQLEFLRAHGCYYAQGRLFGDAMEANKLLGILAGQEGGSPHHGNLCAPTVLRPMRLSS